MRPDRVRDQIAVLVEMPFNELRDQWRHEFGKTPSGRLSRDFLQRALAYQKQAAAIHGLSSATKRELDRLYAALKSGSYLSASRSCSTLLSPGTRLVREWKSVTHEVEVLDRGFAWQGRHYQSLTEIATRISGTRYSGPRFFGLRGGVPAKNREEGNARR